MQSVNPKKGERNRDKAIDKYWDAVNAIPDEDIKSEIRKGTKVNVIEDSTNSIEIPTYPQFENTKRKLIDDAFENY